jgi:hypothetical protein
MLGGFICFIPIDKELQDDYPRHDRPERHRNDDDEIALRKTVSAPKGIGYCQYRKVKGRKAFHSLPFVILPHLSRQAQACDDQRKDYRDYLDERHR